MEPFAIQLSQEELAILLALLGAGALPGVAARAWEGWPPEMRPLGEGVAVRGLMARQLLVPAPGNSLTVDPDLTRLLALCLQPEARLDIAFRLGDGAGATREQYFRTGEIAVQHLLSSAGIHQFTLFHPAPDLDAILAQQVAAHAALAAEAKGAPFALPRAAVEGAQEAANREAQGEAAGRLAAAGAPPASADALARAMTAPTLRLAVELHTTDGEAASLTIVGDDESCWLAWPEGEALRFERATLDRLRAHLAALTMIVEARGG